TIRNQPLRSEAPSCGWDTIAAEVPAQNGSSSWSQKATNSARQTEAQSRRPKSSGSPLALRLSAQALPTLGPTIHRSRSNPIPSNVPHLVGKRVEVIRHSALVCAVALAVFASVDIGVYLIGAGTDRDASWPWLANEICPALAFS